MNLLDLFGIEEEKRNWKKTSAFLKIGKCFTFNCDGHRKNSVGDWECVNFLRLMANREPDTRFVIVTGCDLDDIHPARKRELFPNDNVVYIGQCKSEPRRLGKWDHPLSKECTEAYVMAGPAGTRNGAIDFFKEDGSPFLHIMMNLNYVSPAFHWLNQFEGPVFTMVTDNRYFPKGFDYYKTPKFCAAQFSREDRTYGFYHKRIDGPDDTNSDEKTMKKYRFEIESMRVDTLWLYGREYPTLDLAGKTDKLLVVANQVSDKKDLNKRYHLIKQFLVDRKIDHVIVGKWPSELAQKEFGDYLLSPDGVSATELEDLIPKHKFGVIFNYDTFNTVEGFVDGEDNWVVCKVWEYLYSGVVPILVGFSGAYATVPKQLMVKTPEQLDNLVASLKSLNDAQFVNLIKMMLKPEFFGGEDFVRRMEELKLKYGWYEKKC